MFLFQVSEIVLLCIGKSTDG